MPGTALLSPSLPKAFGLSSQVAVAGSCPVTLTSHNKHSDLARFPTHCQVLLLVRNQPLLGEGGLVTGLVSPQDTGRWRGSETLDDTMGPSSCVTKRGPLGVGCSATLC